jgi:hypothetical protein
MNNVVRSGELLSTVALSNDANFRAGSISALARALLCVTITSHAVA